MKLLVQPSEVGGTVVAPPSKSYTHRALILGYLTGEEFRVLHPLLSQDTEATMRAVRAFGGSCQLGDDGVSVDGSVFRVPSETIDAMNSGTTLRLVTGMASLLDGRTRLTGDDTLRRRPMAPLLDALNQLGAHCEAEGADGKPPLTVKGPISKERASIRGDVSSQFLSSLLISCPLKRSDTVLEVLPPIRSEPYVHVTLEMMRELGVEVDRDERRYLISGGQHYRGSHYSIPGDFSSAAFPLVASVIAGGTVTVRNLEFDRPQADARILKILEDFGAQVVRGEDYVTASPSALVGCDIDVGDTPDLFPVLAVLGAYADGTTRLYNGQHLRFKESDRIETTVRFLKSMGADVEGTPDGCIVRGGRGLRGAEVDSGGDHRILMAAAVAALGARSVTHISDPECYKVSYSNFLEDFRGIGARMEVVA